MKKSNFFKKDPIKNNNLKEYIIDNQFNIEKYYQDVVAQVKKIDLEKINLATKEIIFRIKKKKGTLYFAGNGGSLAIAHHLRCDFGKGLLQKTDKFSTKELGANNALLSALSNDFGYENAFLAEFEMCEPNQNDIVILISSSGNSTNITKIAKFCKAKKIFVIGLTGFSGGILRKKCNLSFHVDGSNYPLIELIHQNILDSIFFNLLNKL